MNHCLNQNTNSVHNIANNISFTRIIIKIILCQILIVFGSYSWFEIVPFTILAILSLNKTDEEILYLYLPLLPISTIFKINNSSISFLTLLMILYVVKKLLFNKWSLKKEFVIILTIYTILSFIIGFGDGIIKIINIIIGFLFVKLMLTSLNGKHFKSSVFIFIYGVVFSVFIGILSEYTSLFPMINASEVYWITFGEYSSRFCGLYGNSNYYTLDITFLISCVLLIITINNFKLSYVFLLSLLLSIGFISVSKSFLVTVVLLFALFILMGLKKIKVKFVGIMLVIVIIALISLEFIPQQYMKLWTIRFTKDINLRSLSEITTHRFDIWIIYFKEIFNSPITTLFGKGIAAPLLEGRGAHNFYLELLYYNGLLGMVLYYLCIEYSIEIKANFIKKTLFLPITALLIRAFGVTMISFDNLFFYFIIIKLAYMYCHPLTVKKKQTEAINLSESMAYQRRGKTV